MTEAPTQEPDVDPKFTKGQLEHVEKLEEAGKWTDEVEAGAQKIQNEVDAGRAEVLGTGAAVVALSGVEQADLAKYRQQDIKTSAANEGKIDKDKTYSLRYAASGDRIATRLDIKDRDNKGVLEAENIGAALIDRAVTVRGGAKVADGAHIGLGSFLHDNAKVGRNVELGDVYVGGTIGENTKIARGAIGVNRKVGANVDASNASLNVRHGGEIGDDVTVNIEPGDVGLVQVFGKVGKGATLNDGVVVEEARDGKPAGEVAPGATVPRLTNVKPGEVFGAEVAEESRLADATEVLAQTPTTRESVD